MAVQEREAAIRRQPAKQGARPKAGTSQQAQPADSPWGTDDARSTNLRDSPMMAHLLNALEAGEDVGHYGRLTVCMVARHFMDEEELITLLARQPEQDEHKVRAMLAQVKARNYNPPKRERILQWQGQQEFVICPDSDNPAACNVYRELQFPEGIYDQIEEFWEEQSAE